MGVGFIRGNQELYGLSLELMGYYRLVIERNYGTPACSFNCSISK